MATTLLFIEVSLRQIADGKTNSHKKMVLYLIHTTMVTE